MKKAAEVSLRVVVDMEYSKLWMQQFAVEMHTDVDGVLRHAEQWLNNGTEWDEGMEFLNLATPDDFWQHYKNITGEDGDGDFIACTC